MIMQRLQRLPQPLPWLAPLALAATALVYIAGFNGPAIRSDGIGYYSYLAAFVAHGDPTFEALESDPWLAEEMVKEEEKRPGMGHDLPRWTGIQRYEPTGQYIVKYSMGVAVMELPFFLAGRVFGLLIPAWRSPFSFPHQVFVGLAGVFWFLVGAVLLRRMLVERFGETVARPALIATLFGLPVFHYGTYDSTFSHAFSFALICALLFQTPRWLDRPTLGRSALLGAIAGLIVLVRIPNAIFLLLVPLYGVGSLAAVGARLRWARDHLGAITLTLSVAALTFAPQIAYWYAMTGRLALNPYSGEGFDFLHPEVLGVLFSDRKGLFIWTPVAALSLVGLARGWRADRGTVLPAALVLCLLLWIAAAWHMWWFGGGFGHRVFTEAAPLFAFGIGHLLHRPRAPFTTRMAIQLCTGYTVILMVLYWVGVLPFDGPEFGWIV